MAEQQIVNGGLTFPPVKYSTSEMEIRQAVAQYQELHIIPADNENYVAVVRALGVLRKYRTGIEKDRKEIGRKILDFKTLWDDDAKRLTAILEPEETRLQVERIVEDKRKEDIRLADERAEQERIARIKNSIQAIRGKIPQVPQTSSQLEDLLWEIESHFLNSPEGKYQEFKEEAEIAYAQTMQAINSMLETRLQWEKEETDRKAEIALLAALKQEREEEERRMAVEKAKAEAERKAGIEAEQLRNEAEKAKIETERAKAEAKRIKLDAERIAREEESRKKLAEAMRQIKEKEDAVSRERAKFEAEKRIEEERKAREAWAIQEKAEREEFEKKAKIKAEIEAREKTEREKLEKKARAEAEIAEKARQEALRPEKEKLLAWLDDSLQSVPLPCLKSDHCKKLLALCRRSLDELLAEMRRRINE